MRAVLALSPSRCHTRSACGSYLFRAQLLSGSSSGSWMPHSSYMLMVCGVWCVVCGVCDSVLFAQGLSSLYFIIGLRHCTGWAPY